MGIDQELGTIEAGKLTDLVVVAENSVHNLKVLYGTGAIRVDRENRVYRAGGVRYTIKNGVVFDAEQTRAGLREEVRRAWEEQGRVLTQPEMAEERDM